jgi:hypothetical protein
MEGPLDGGTVTKRSYYLWSSKLRAYSNAWSRWVDIVKPCKPSLTANFDRIAIGQVLPYEAMPHNPSVSDERINVKFEG